jgi:hypothetical protein
MYVAQNLGYFCNIQKHCPLEKVTQWSNKIHFNNEVDMYGNFCFYILSYIFWVGVHPPPDTALSKLWK